MTTSEGTPEAEAVLLRFVRGEPDAEQIAAATAALLAIIRGRQSSVNAAEELAGVAGWTPERSYGAPGGWASGPRGGHPMASVP